MGIRLLVVDGHTLHRFGLAQLIVGQPDIETVGEAGTAAACLPLVASLRPDVVTLDIALPDRNGLTLARELRARWPDLGIVVLTSVGEDDALFRAMETGVSAFILKTASTSQITTAIRHAAVAASSFTAPGLVAALDRLRVSRDHSPLSRRETDMLDKLQHGLSIPEAARAMHVSTSTAKTYVSRLYDKLGANNRSQALMAAVRLHLIESDAPDHHDEVRARMLSTR
ncbi:MAG TPA: response regulator transcription factor [Umezawaea sp.]|nr:response regulator transcription factor [Umezawaea sp.]